VKTPEVDFLCIGAQRAGTTFLHRSLRKHPGIWLPPCKELQYFSRSPKYESPTHICDRSAFSKLFSLSEEGRAWRRFVAPRIRFWLSEAEQFRWTDLPDRLGWFSRYRLHRPSDQWYRSLFQAGSGKIKGEITPAYSLLDEGDVAAVAETFPRLKIILLMRDPVERVFSQLRLHLEGRLSPSLQSVSDPAILRFATGPSQLRRGDYPTILKLWQRYFPDNVLAVFQEDLRANGALAVGNILEFLGSKTCNAVDALGTAERRMPSAAPKLPPALIRLIAERHRDIVRDCAASLGGHAIRWAEKCEALCLVSKR
jgi:hypothetical protein